MDYKLKGRRLAVKIFIFLIFLAYITPRPPMSVHEKFQPNRSSRLAGYTQHALKVNHKGIELLPQTLIF